MRQCRTVGSGADVHCPPTRFQQVRDSAAARTVKFLGGRRPFSSDAKTGRTSTAALVRLRFARQTASMCPRRHRADRCTWDAFREPRTTSERVEWMDRLIETQGKQLDVAPGRRERPIRDMHTWSSQRWPLYDAVKSSLQALQPGRRCGTYCRQVSKRQSACISFLFRSQSSRVDVQHASMPCQRGAASEPLLP